MQDSVLYLVLILICIVIYLLIKQRTNKKEVNKEAEEIANLNAEIVANIDFKDKKNVS